MWIIRGLAFSVGIAVSFVSGVEGQGILDSLVAYDQAFLSGLTLTLTASYPTSGFDPSQGSSTATVRITSDGITQAMHLQRLRMDPPHFSGNRIRGDYGNYDEAGRYILHTASSMSVLLGPDSWKTQIGRLQQSIDLSNTVVATFSPAPFIEVRPTGHPDALNRVYRYLLPLGRGFSNLLDQVTSETPLENGLTRITARGHLFSPKKGEWILELDTAQDYLVRAATFTSDGSGDPTSIVSADPSAGVVGGPLVLWGGGTLVLASGYVIQVQLDAYDPAPDSALIRQVEKDVTTVAENSTVIDFSSPDAQGRPLILKGVAVP